MENSLPPIPSKRYFTISEVSKLCGIKPHVLRYWEQEFAQLRPMKRRGNRRYYQSHEIELVRQIRQLLHEQGFTIVGARNKLQVVEPGAANQQQGHDGISSQRKLQENQPCNPSLRITSDDGVEPVKNSSDSATDPGAVLTWPLLAAIRNELIDIRDLLGPIS